MDTSDIGKLALAQEYNLFTNADRHEQSHELVLLFSDTTFPEQ
jgi:hypothetical protein